MATPGDVAEGSSGVGPDWGQVALVALAISILALTAVAAPALGGAGLGDRFDGAGDSASDASALPSLGEDGPGTGDDADAGSDDVESSGTGAGDGSAAGDAGAAAADSDSSGADTDGIPDEDRRAGANADDVGPEDGIDSPGAQGSQDSQEPDGDGPSSAPGDADAETADNEPGDAVDGEPADAEADDSAVDGAASDPDADHDAGGTEGEGVTEADGDDSMAADDDELGDADGMDERDGVGDGDTTATGDGADDTDAGTAGGDAADDGDATFDTGDDEATASTDGADDGPGDGTDERANDDTDPAEGDAPDAGSDGDSSDLLEDGAGDDGDASYGIVVEDELTPGGEATVTVTEDGDPLEGATVFFDGEAVGTTDAAGQVTGTIPYTTELEVTIDPDGPSQPSIVRGAAGGPGSAGPQLSGTTVDPGVTPQAANDTFEVTAETALEVDEPLVAGAETTVTATVNDVAIPQGTVLIAGEDVGTTDDDGTATVTVPESVADDSDDGEARTATVAVEREEIRAERTVPVRLLEVDVDTLLALPGRTVDVSVTDGGEPVDGAPVTLAAGDDADLDETGSEVTTTENGTASVDLPIASAATIGASHEGATAETTVEGLYRNAAVLGLVVLGALALVGRTVAGRVDVSRDAVRSLPARIVAFVAVLGTRAVDAVVGLADAIGRLGSWVGAQFRSVVRALERAVRWLIGLPRALADRGLIALAALDPRRLWRWLRGVVSGLLASSRDRLERSQSSPEAPPGSADSAAGAVDEATATTVRALWAEFVQLVGPPRLPTKTPGEVGRYAVEKGMPERPVRTVVGVFRDVEYGRQTPDGERLERVRSAVDAVDSDGSAGLEPESGPDANAPPEPTDDHLESDATRGGES